MITFQVPFQPFPDSPRITGERTEVKASSEDSLHTLVGELLIFHSNYIHIKIQKEKKIYQFQNVSFGEL